MCIYCDLKHVCQSKRANAENKIGEILYDLISLTDAYKELKQYRIQPHTEEYKYKIALPAKTLIQNLINDI